MSDILEQFKAANPDYANVPNDVLAGKLYEKYYSNIPREQFNAKIGLTGQAYKGSVLPFSADASGKVSFDSNAGILGSLKRAFTLPGDVLTGKTDPMSDEGRTRTLELGALVAPSMTAAPVTEAGLMGANRMVAQKPKVPTAEELNAASKAGYDQARNLGVEYAPDAVGQMAHGVRQMLEQKGIIPELTPKTFAILDKLQSGPSDSVATLANLEAARRAFGNAAKDFSNPTEQLAASHAIDAIDGFIAAAHPPSVVAGPASAAGNIMEKARGNYAAASRSDRVTGAQERGELNAAVANSGQNVDNAIRQRLKAILTAPKQARGFTEEELDAIEAAAKGSAGSNAARMIGNLLGGGGGLGAVVTGGVTGAAAGGAAGNPLIGAAVGVGAPTLGMAAKAGANALTRRNIAQLDEMLRMRSPLYQDRVANPNMVPKGPPDMLTRAALAGLLGSSDPATGGLLGP